jgi:hypothetical protein
VKTLSAITVLVCLTLGACGDDDQGAATSAAELSGTLESVADSLDEAGIDYRAEVLDSLGEEDPEGLVVQADSGTPIVIHDGEVTTQIRVDGLDAKTPRVCGDFIAEGRSGDLKQVLDEAGLCP